MKEQEKNLCAKTVKPEQAYEVWQSRDGWQWFVLKKYQKPTAEAKNLYARWYCAVRSPYTRGTFELGDCYVRDVRANGNHPLSVNPLTDKQIGA